MSKAFNHFPLSEIGYGSWIGEDAFFMELDYLGYSIRTKSTVRVLEIDMRDFNDKMPPEMMKDLKELAL